MGDRDGDWIQLISGEPFWPLDARPEEVHIEDIAWALSMQCRYTGHVRKFYSVAEHSVMVSRIVWPEYALWGLLHDAAEAYLADLSRPIKRLMPDYRAYEDALLEVIAERFGLALPMPDDVKRADYLMLQTEKRKLLAEPKLEWGPAQGGVVESEIVRVVLPCWSPAEANEEFLQRFKELVGNA